MRIAKLIEGFGDHRLSKRHATLMERAANAPGQGFPEMMGSDSELEAAYRFLNNKKVTLDRLLEPHIAATIAAAEQAGIVYALHDGTWFEFGGEDEREGLGRVASGRRKHGFLGHFALAVSADQRRSPMGLLGVTVKSFTQPIRKKKVEPLTERRSQIWLDMAKLVHERVNGRTSVIHVMDREADDYRLYESLIDRQDRFIIRVQYDRPLQTDGTADPERHIREFLSGAETVVERDVSLTARGKRRPARPKIPSGPKDSDGAVALPSCSCCRATAKQSNGRLRAASAAPQYRPSL